MAPFRILISGAGIAGPAVALLLARHRDCAITIIERAASLRSTGQQIDLRNQGVPIMQKLGLEEAVRARIVKEEGTRIINRAGAELAFIPALQTGSGKQSLSSEFEIMRGDLVDVLYQATKDLDNVKYVFGRTIESLIEGGDGPIGVGLSDGTTHEYDLVIGADGVGSRTRKLMLAGGEEQDKQVRQATGVQLAFFTIPVEKDDSRAFTICRSTKGRHLMTRRDRDDVLRVLFMAHVGQAASGGKGDSEDDRLRAQLHAANRSGDLEQKKKAWAAYYADAGWQAERFTHALLHSKEADDLYAQELQRVVLPPGAWSGRNGRVTVVGDAACCVALNRGLGTTVSFVTAYTLAGELARHCIPLKGSGAGAKQQPTRENLEHALAEYERKTRVLTDPVQKGMPGWFPWAGGYSVGCQRTSQRT
ncbi:uncharacterized protein B0I36DRAFT_370642 [Microdochium trichocladiopsis]|uniref:FAD-binding domain-containing protein n=1 Tax=Microdochium trichocladiopsis TaxID=1682393 RepID=A0A9P8XNW6_9PEZI|nr:uncharacterized protein B0I36DRAFT_370642 [Microdochium trichocladiopsis]KAH7007860.1 hypothetical protein B0I36DRAFT_370642 [Microdochium trichocladiopsis]